MKLVFFSFGILEQGGGFENYVIETATGLKRYHSDVEIEIVSTTPNITEKLQSLLSIYYFKKIDKRSIYRESRADILKRLGEVNYVNVSSLSDLKKCLSDADYIYTKNEVLELTVIKYIGYKNLPPVIIGIHTPVYYPYVQSFSAKLHNLIYTGFIYKSLIKNSYKIKTNTDEDMNYIKETFNYDQVYTVHHAFEVKPLRVRKKNDDSKVLNLLFVGRLTEQKGVDIMMGIIDHLDANNKISNVKIRIAGSGETDYENRVKEYANRFANVDYLGHVPNRDIYSLYEWTDATIIPSRYETLNKVAIETCIAGKIAVSSDIAGPREFITNNHNGYLVDLNVKAFTDKLDQIMEMKKNNAKEFYLIGKNAHNTIKNDFNPNKVYDDFYDTLLC